MTCNPSETFGGISVLEIGRSAMMEKMEPNHFAEERGETAEVRAIRVLAKPKPYYWPRNSGVTVTK